MEKAGRHWEDVLHEYMQKYDPPLSRNDAYDLLLRHSVEMASAASLNNQQR